MSAPAPEVSSDTNALLRLQLIARECPHRELGDWLWEGCRRVLLDGITLDEALGVTGAGWTNPRQVARHDRRDALLREFYLVCYPDVSLRAAATLMVADHARLTARCGRLRPRRDLISRAPETAIGFHALLAAEGHAMPGVSHLRSVLRRVAIRPVADLDPVETGHPPAAASEDDAA